MRNSLLLVLAVALSASGAAITWNAADSATNTNWSNNANWSGGVAPGSTDTAVFDATGGSKSPTIDISPSIAAVRIASTYTRAWSLSGQTLTCSNGFSDDGATGAKNYGNGITCNGANSTFHIGAVGTVTATACSLTFNGANMTHDDDKGVQFRKLILGSNVKLNCIGASGNTSYGGTPPLLVMGGGCKITVGSVLTMYPTASGRYVSGSQTTDTIVGGSTINFYVNTNSIADTISGFFTNGAATFQISDNVAKSNIVRVLGMNLNVGTFADHPIANSTASTFYNGYGITCATFSSGSSVAGASNNSRFSSGYFNVGSFNGSTYNTGTIIDSMQQSSWICRGSWTNGNNHTVVPGAFRVAFANTAKATITSNNKPFYDVVDSASVGVVDSLADSITCHDLTIKSGKWKSGGQNINLSGNFAWANTCSDTIFNRMGPNYWTFTAADPVLTLQGTGKRLLDSAQWRPINSLTIVMDSNNTIKSFAPTRAAAGQRWTMQASRTLTLYMNPDYGWSGQGGTPDTMKSSTPGSYARIGLASAKACSSLVLKDMAFQNAALTCTTGCYNGGNDSNVIWDTLKVSAISPSTIAATGGPCTLTVVHGRAVGGSVTVAGSGASLTSQTATRYIFTAPAHAAGAVDVVAQSGLGLDPGDDTVTLTYANPCTATVLTRAPTQTVTVGVSITTMAHPHTGGTPDSFTISPALPTGLSLNKTTGDITGTPSVATVDMVGYAITGYACSGTSVVYDSLNIRGIPILTTLKHPMGRIGYADTIIGSGFYTTGGTATVGGTSVTITRQVADSLIWTVPTKARGTYDWIFTNKYGLKDTVSFRVLVPGGMVSP